MILGKRLEAFIDGEEEKQGEKKGVCATFARTRDVYVTVFAADAVNIVTCILTSVKCALEKSKRCFAFICYLLYCTFLCVLICSIGLRSIIALMLMHVCEDAKCEEREPTH